VPLTELRSDGSRRTAPEGTHTWLMRMARRFANSLPHRLDHRFTQWHPAAVGGGSGIASADAVTGTAEPSRAVQRDFWRRIASGVTTVGAAEAVGVSWPVGSRWADFQRSSQR